MTIAPRLPSAIVAASSVIATAADLPVKLTPFSRGYKEVTDFRFLPGQPDLLVVLEQKGTMKWAHAKKGVTGTLLELDVLRGYELGLLGIAFHPDFERNRKFYLNYNPRDQGPMRTRISEWTLAQRNGDFKVTGERVLFEVEQPYSNHNGGQLAFGPDRLLYIGTGDGGSGGDPENRAQDPGSLLGKMLRLDVDRPGAKPEIWAKGLRNPWRYSFDLRGRLVVADVGQNELEEISILKKGDNAGWRLKEGSRCFNPKKGCERPDLVDPIIEYGRDEGGTIIGGYEYKGKRIRELAGQYVYADFLSGRIWAARLPDKAERVDPKKISALGKWPVQPSTFAQDANGELYVADYGGGVIYRIDPPGAVR